MRDALANASFIGFTGTLIEKMDANERAVFGDYISIYDIQRAVADKGHCADLLLEPHRQDPPLAAAHGYSG
jgi:type I site-specific restriction-modification system R (restriction) subunit